MWFHFKGEDILSPILQITDILYLLQECSEVLSIILRSRKAKTGMIVAITWMIGITDEGVSHMDVADIPLYGIDRLINALPYHGDMGTVHHDAEIIMCFAYRLGILSYQGCRTQQGFLVEGMVKYLQAEFHITLLLCIGAELIGGEDQLLQIGILLSLFVLTGEELELLTSPLVCLVNALL